jgi:acyl-CoA reductase-like NAD-dependent aldehyde dehydrogenase
VGEVAVSSSEEISRAITRAESAFRAWRDVPLRKRADVFRRLRTGLLKARGKISDLVAREQGKPLLEACIAEIFPCLDQLTFLIHDGPRILAPQPAKHRQPFLRARRGRYHFQPYGVWALISPWNYPFCIPFLQAAALVFAGNAVVLKPSPLTPHCGALVAELFRAAGFPDGLLEVIQGGPAEGERLVRDPTVRAVLFTGGAEGGRKVASAAASGLKKVVLELGGKDAAIVLADAPLERTARGIAWAAMANAGQTCASVERVYVESAVSERFKKLLAEQIAALRVGHPLEPATDVGPVTAQFQLEKVKAHVDDARARGAVVTVGGKSREDLGALFYSPTVIEEPPSDARVIVEETFGPVVCVQTVGGADEAVRRTNASELGLTASIWTRNRRLASELAPRIECGVVTINSHLTTYGESNSAWGGFRSSGFGRTHGEYGLREAVEVQYIDEGYGMKPEICWHPYGGRLREIVETTFALIAEPSPVVRAATMVKLFPHIRYLARHVPIARMLPGFVRYLT